MKYCGLMRSDIANGDGVRVTLWCSGCSVHCKGCQNPETWDFDAGLTFDESVKVKIFAELSKPYVQGLTISGGNPLEPKNLQAVWKLVHDVVEYFGTEKDIWLYTGFSITYDDFMLNGNVALAQTLLLCDYVVDGPYIESQRDITLPFRGSKNQRIIDVEKTLRARKIVEWEGEKLP